MICRYVLAGIQVVVYTGYGMGDLCFHSDAGPVWVWGMRCMS